MEFFNDVGGDPSRPSLFELIAQEQLRDLLQPAVKYVLSVFAQRYPRYLIRVVNRHEEFYALMMLFVERHYLKTRSASFAENFYGLKRRRTPLYETERTNAAVGGAGERGKLTDRALVRSLLFLVAVPYLRAKTQEYYEILGGGVDSDLLDEDLSLRMGPASADGVNPQQTMTQRLKAAYKKIYPWANIGYETWLMYYNVAYLFDRTTYYRPWLSWIGVDLRRLGPEDMRSLQQSTQLKVGPVPPASILHTLRRIILQSPRLLLDSLKVLLPTAIFFIKFLEWWYSPSSPARTVTAIPSGPPIPPPKLLTPHPQGVQIHRSKYGDCPLCSGPLANATALPSGYVFCYRCIHSYVEQYKRCPVTLTTAHVWQLRKIMI